MSRLASPIGGEFSRRFEPLQTILLPPPVHGAGPWLNSSPHLERSKRRILSYVTLSDAK